MDPDMTAHAGTEVILAGAIMAQNGNDGHAKIGEDGYRG
jgi:hypothetical protein